MRIQQINSDMKCKKFLVNTLVTIIVVTSLCEARGGRRGGSFGGLFGSWRKYKKPSSGGGNTRRIVSSSPVHTPITKAWHENKKSSSSDKFYKNYNTNHNNEQLLPTGGSYYQNTATLPGNAIYVAQGPPRGAEFGDFLTGYLTGRLLTMGFQPPHYHVTHVYRESVPVDKDAIKLNNTFQFIDANGQQEMLTEKPFNAPLVNITKTTESNSIRDFESTTAQTDLMKSEKLFTPPYGVICVPILLSDGNATGEAAQNERIVCYPAPAPPTPQNEIRSKPVEIAGDIIEP